ncbi:MAG TPA: NAD(P)-binding domain-containing protein, partial [Chroococcales cyanobacterium]
MRVTIIGAGRVGSTLGARLAQVGHEISYVVRDAGSTKHGQLQETASHITADIGSATADADAIIVALPWSEVESCLKKAGPLNGKMIIDATNPLELSEAGLARGLTIGHDSSGGEKIAQWLPNAHVSKAFNTVGVEVMQNP